MAAAAAPCRGAPFPHVHTQPGPVHSHGHSPQGFLGCEGRWCLGRLQKFPCLPQVPEVPIWPSGQGL